MSISLVQINDKYIIPKSQGITFIDYPIVFYGEVYITSGEVTSSQEFLQLWITGSVGVGNRFVLKTRNNLTSTPASKTQPMVEQKANGSSTISRPVWDDAWSLDAWNQFVFSIIDPSTAVLEVNGVEQIISLEITRNVFNDSNEFGTIYVLSRAPIGSKPHIGDWANCGLSKRLLTVQEKADLRLYWGSSLSSLGDGDLVHHWNLDDDILASHGGVDLEDIVGGSYTMDGGNNPALTLKSSTNVIGLVRTAGGKLLMRGNGLFKADRAPVQSTANTTFTMSNEELAASKGWVRIPVCFAEAEVPVGFVPQVNIQGGAEVTAIQFDLNTTYPDGSLQLAVCKMRDTDISGGSARAYNLTSKTGSFSNSATFDWADISGNSEFTLVATNLKDATTNSTVGSGSYEFDWNTASAVVTRREILEAGGVCTTFYCWGMFKDQTGGAEDHSLKGEGWITIWDDGTSVVNDNIEYAFRISQDWYEQTGKDRRTYNLELFDGVTSIWDYGAIDQPYQTSWMTLRMTPDNQHGKRWFKSANMPTLVPQMDKDQLVASGCMPPLDTNHTPTESTATSIYVPMDNMGHPSNLQQAEGPSRGVTTLFGAQAFMLQTASSFRRMRVNDLGLAFHPGHNFRSNKQRTRSGESADVANTAISFIMAPLSAGEYDFTGDGLPVAQHAYSQASGEPELGGYDDYLGGDGEFTLDKTARNHGSNPGQAMYVLEGEPYMVDALHAYGMGVMHHARGNVGGGRPELLQYSREPRRTAWSIPSNPYDAIFIHKIQNYRHNGWAGSALGAMYALCPDARPESNYFNKLIEHNGNFLTESLSYWSADYKAKGLLYERTGNDVQAPFMDAICGVGLYNFFALTKNAGIKEAAQLQVDFQVNLWNKGSYWAHVYRVLVKLYVDDDDLATNPILAPADWLGGNAAHNPTTAVDDRVALPHPVDGDYIAEDPASYYGRTGGASNANIPAEFVEGSTYYADSPSAGDSFRLAATPGGAHIAVLADEAQSAIFVNMSDLDKTIVGDAGFLIPGGDSTFAQNFAAMMQGWRWNHPNIDQALVDKMNAFIDNPAYDNAGDEQWKMVGS